MENRARLTLHSTESHSTFQTCDSERIQRSQPDLRAAPPKPSSFQMASPARSHCWFLSWSSHGKCHEMAKWGMDSLLKSIWSPGKLESSRTGREHRAGTVSGHNLPHVPPPLLAVFWRGFCRSLPSVFIYVHPSRFLTQCFIFNRRCGSNSRSYVQMYGRRGVWMHLCYIMPVLQPCDQCLDCCPRNERVEDEKKP